MSGITTTPITRPRPTRPWRLRRRTTTSITCTRTTRPRRRQPQRPQPRRSPRITTAEVEAVGTAAVDNHRHPVRGRRGAAAAVAAVATTTIMGARNLAGTGVATTPRRRSRRTAPAAATPGREDRRTIRTAVGEGNTATHRGEVTMTATAAVVVVEGDIRRTVDPPAAVTTTTEGGQEEEDRRRSLRPMAERTAASGRVPVRGGITRTTRITGDLRRLRRPCITGGNTHRITATEGTREDTRHRRPRARAVGVAEVPAW